MLEQGQPMHAFDADLLDRIYKLINSEDIGRTLDKAFSYPFMDEPFSGVDVASEKTIVELLIELQKEGKTIFVVHHDLQSAMDYFDWMILINKRIVANGPISEVFNSELLQKTYGGNLSLLDKIGQIFKEKQFPIRED